MESDATRMGRGFAPFCVGSISLRPLHIGAIVFFLITCGMVSACDSPTEEKPKTLGPYDILLPEPYPELQLNVHNLTQFPVENQGISRKLDRLSQMIEKPITVVHISAGDKAAQEWNITTLDDYLRGAEAPEPAPGTMPIEVLFVEGVYEKDEEEAVLGLSWGGNRVAVFLNTLRSACESSDLFSTQAEQATACKFAASQVLTHEFGHLIGLVNNGIPMVHDHLDPAFEHHDRDPECLMYWANSRTRIFERLAARGSEENAWFCDSCQEDIRSAIEP